MKGDSELRIVTDAMPAAAVRCARDGTFLWVNALYARWVGRAPEQVVGRKLGEVVGREAMREIEPHLRRVLAGEHVQYERLARFPGLEGRWLSWSYTPTGEGWVAIGVDIHDRKVAEEALKAAEPAIARAAQTGVIHRNTASRTVSRLSARVKKLG